MYNVYCVIKLYHIRERFLRNFIHLLYRVKIELVYYLRVKYYQLDRGNTEVHRVHNKCKSPL